ncbi:CPK3 [Symbiodinium natans]|uniref:CPK3 protein n=1 Tax=Symbiodinium natans TaxID=878477 RepID=A0A812SDP5_9DINO|nr:CPK3 [Symbiodinium natans]
MGQAPSQSSAEAVNARDSSLPAGGFQSGLYSFLLGCTTPCSDAGFGESSGSLAKVVQHCCIASEREGVLELVEQHRVIGDAVTLIEDNAWSAPMGTEILEGCRRKLHSRPQTDRRFEEIYKLGYQIGEGSFGNVHKASANSPAGAKARTVAVKVFSLGSPIASPQAKIESEESKRKFSSFVSEYAMLSRLDHPQIIRMHESFQTASDLHLVLEMCQGGELYALLVRRIKEENSGGHGLLEEDVRVFFRQMLWAVGYLHSRRIVHRDIKPENFLVYGEPGEPQADVLKLCDFGTAMLLTDQKPRSMVNIGTLSYTAPEVYMRKGADLPADTWSLGVVLYVMLTGTNPFRAGKDTSKQDTVKKIKTGEFATQRPGWLKVSENGQDLVRKLLVLGEDKRLTCVQAQKHEWLLAARRMSLPPDEEEPETLAVTVVRLLRQMQRLEDPQRYALLTCALGATEADLPQPSAWRLLFLGLDQDSDGVLSMEELTSGLRKLAGVPRAEVSDDELNTAAKAADVDGSGNIDWAEWLAVGLLSAELSQADVLLETAHRLLCRLWSENSTNDVVLAIWKFAQELRPQQQKEAGKVPLSIADLRLVLTSCQGQK